MKVVCIDNKNGGDYLTIGKLYEVQQRVSSLDSEYYYITNDRGEKMSLYWTHQFKLLEDIRDMKLREMGF